MWTNSAIPIVQQKRGELITNMIVRTYKNCTIIQNYAKELEYNKYCNTFYNRMKYYVVRTSLSFFIVCSALAAGYNV